MAIGRYTQGDRQTDPEHSEFLEPNRGNSGLNTHRATRNEIKKHVNNFRPQNPDANGLAMTSTNVFIYSNGNIVGMISDFQVNEGRNTVKLQAIGTEGVIQQVPNNTNGGTLSVKRIALYSSNIWNALGLATDGNGYDQTGAMVYNRTDENSWDTSSVYANESSNRTLAAGARIVFKTLKDQRVPLEIQVRTPLEGSGVFGVNEDEDSAQYYTETYIDCWLNSYGKGYASGTITVTEDVSIDYADVY